MSGRTDRLLRDVPIAPALWLAAGFFLAAGSALAGETWPQFRGPGGDGQADDAALPLTWSETNHIRWKTPIHDRGWASPVIWSNQIWLATATKDGHRLYAVCVDRESGAVVRDLKLFDVEHPQFCHDFNTYASPTPVIEAGRVYVTFGSPGTACLDTATGQKLWERRDLECNHFRGAGSSPILYGNLLLMHFDGSDHQYVVALDKHTGRTVWRVNRSIDYQDLGAGGQPQAEGDFRKAFATPHVATLDGRPTLISLGSKAAYGYDPLTGRELWRLEDRTSFSASTRPVVGHDTIFFLDGWSRGQIVAFQPATNYATLDVASPAARTGTNGLRVLWIAPKNAPKKPSLLLANDLLFAIEDTGVASCLEADTGRELWHERLGGNFSASPILAGDRVYCFSENGRATVFAASHDFRKLAENTLADGFMASPAVAGNALFLRTQTHLYRVEAPATGGH